VLDHLPQSRVVLNRKLTKGMLVPLQAGRHALSVMQVRDLTTAIRPAKYQFRSPVDGLNTGLHRLCQFWEDEEDMGLDFL
jgi:hypothetical protein